MDGLKVVVIGGGSSYTPELADGIIKKYASFPVNELILVDIESGREKVAIVCALIKRMFEKAALDIHVSYTFNRREALEGANFVITQFRIGGLAARTLDEKIPLQYNMVGQETTGPGGFAKALRTIPVILDICRDIKAVAPEAWLINFTNPAGIVTEAVSKYSKVKCIGLCNIPLNMEKEILDRLELDKSKLRCRFAGLNHLSFVGRICMDGEDILKKMLGSHFKLDGWAKNIPGIDMPEDFINILGYIPSPYLKYYYFERQMLAEQKKKFSETNKTRADDVKEVERRLFDAYRNVELREKPKELSERGGALYSVAAIALMDSIWNDRSDIQVVNTLNLGCIPELPPNVVIETSCIINRKGAIPLIYGALPSSIKGLIQQVKAYEENTIEAAVTGDRNKALVALVNNPLVHDVFSAKQVLNDLLEVHRDYLGVFFKGEANHELCSGS
jgi:Alpha-galactosidases/6-phospho-beta-glucosidases, family 4 of glycosyl hydrolases